MAEQFSALDLCYDGRVVTMWVPILAATTVLMPLSKTLYHNCFSLPMSKWVPVRAELVVVFDWPCAPTMSAIELYTPQGAGMVSGMIYATNEQG